MISLYLFKIAMKSLLNKHGCILCCLMSKNFNEDIQPFPFYIIDDYILYLSLSKLYFLKHAFIS